MVECRDRGQTEETDYRGQRVKKKTNKGGIDI